MSQDSACWERFVLPALRALVERFGGTNNKLQCAREAKI